MAPYIKHLWPQAARGVEAIPHNLQALIFGAFSTSVALSFFNALNQPLLYAVVFALSSFAFASFDRSVKTSPHTLAHYPSNDFIPSILIISGCLLVLLAFFMMPISDDGQRIKLARIIMGVKTGSAWITSSVDTHSTMYIMPAPFFLIFTPIEALRLPQFSYALFNTFLIIGSLVNLSLLFGRALSLQTVLYLTLFMLAPQFMFAGLTEHEDALTFFLATRTLYWLIAKPPTLESIFFAALCGILAVATKYTTIVFLPFALIALMLAYGDRDTIRAWFTPKTIFTAIILAVPIAFLVFLPDMKVDAARNTSVVDQIKYLGKLHGASTSHCGAGHFALRWFEWLIDPLRMNLNVLNKNLTAYIPEGSLLPAGCTHDDASFRYYVTPNLLVRESTQFGWIPIVALASLFVARGRQHRTALISILLFTVSVAIYSFSFSFWSGTGRYFMVGMLILIPAFVIAVETLKERVSEKIFVLLVLILLGPATLVFIRSESGLNKLPRIIRDGNLLEERAAGILPTLRQMHGPVNIYFNDLMSFYMMLRQIPSQDVYLKKELLPNTPNILALPQENSPETNWHDDYWLLPIPSARGDFTFMGPTHHNIGNKVPTTFYIGTPNHSVDTADAFTIVHFPCELKVETWLKSLGTSYHSRRVATKEGNVYFIQHGDSKNGLCLKTKGQDITWPPKSSTYSKNDLCLKTKGNDFTWHTGSLTSCPGSR